MSDFLAEIATLRDAIKGQVEKKTKATLVGLSALISIGTVVPRWLLLPQSFWESKVQVAHPDNLVPKHFQGNRGYKDRIFRFHYGFFCCGHACLEWQKVWIEEVFRV